MSEESRLGREAIETAYALKQLVQAGVRVFFYLEDRERTLNSPTDRIMLSLTTFADELEREKARQRTYDAMQRKARAGHVTGGRVFGYDQAEVLGADGRRSHVERRTSWILALILATSGTALPEGLLWTYEVKWDGYGTSPFAPSRLRLRHEPHRAFDLLELRHRRRQLTPQRQERALRGRDSLGRLRFLLAHQQVRDVARFVTEHISDAR
jgi:hypothetical protein